MAKIIRLTESDLARIVRRIMNEQKPVNTSMPKKSSSIPQTKKPSLTGKTVKLYKDLKQRDILGDYRIKNVQAIGGSAFVLFLEPYGNQSFRLIQITADCGTDYFTSRTSYRYYNKQLVDYIHKNFCKKGSGGISVPATTDFVATEPTPESFA